MSIEVITWVFKHSETRLADRLVLLALADYAHDDGSQAFPSIKTLAQKARVGERTVERSLGSLKEGGAIEPMEMRGRTVVYRVKMDDAAKLAGKPVSPIDAKQPANGGTQPARSDDGPYREPLEPSGNRSTPKTEDFDPKVVQLCKLMVQRQEERYGPDKRTKISKTGLDEMRRLIDLDGRSVKEVEDAINWVHMSSFWRKVILSPSNLREHWARIKADAIEQRNGNGGSKDAQRRALHEARERGESL